MGGSHSKGVERMGEKYVLLEEEVLDGEKGDIVEEEMVDVSGKERGRMEEKEEGVMVVEKNYSGVENGECGNGHGREKGDGVRIKGRVLKGGEEKGDSVEVEKKGLEEEVVVEEKKEEECNGVVGNGGSYDDNDDEEGKDDNGVEEKDCAEEDGYEEERREKGWVSVREEVGDRFVGIEGNKDTKKVEEENQDKGTENALREGGVKEDKEKEADEAGENLEEEQQKERRIVVEEYEEENNNGGVGSGGSDIDVKKEKDGSVEEEDDNRKYWHQEEERRIADWGNVGEVDTRFSEIEGNKDTIIKKKKKRKKEKKDTIKVEEENREKEAESAFWEGAVGGDKENDVNVGEREKYEAEENIEGQREEKKHLSCYPQRPTEPDCAFYIRNGSCGYGLNCKFNHPPDRITNKMESSNLFQSGQSPKYATGESGGERVKWLQCKYYLSPGGCKSGSACRFAHNQEGTATESVKLNFMGLPIRHGEKECPFYMRTGSCKFSTNCMYHHPDPTEGHGNGLSDQPPTEPRPFSGSWNFNKMPNISTSSTNAPQSFSPECPNQSWNGYQHPANSLSRPGMRSGPPSGSCPTNNRYQQHAQSGEFSLRPGQPLCSYYMKTGDCKFKSACKFNHPKNRDLNFTCLLSPLGLPLRPGQSVCTHYSRHGICKFGPTCTYDHPMQQFPSQVGPQMTSP